MRVQSPRLAFNHKPVTGRGAALYAGVGPVDGSDPGPNSVVFRKRRVIPKKWVKGSSFSIGNGVKKCAIIGQTADPVASITYTKPAEWNGRIVYLQVRTWWDCCENTHNSNPVRLDFTAEGLIDSQIHGTGNIISVHKRDGGIYRLKLAYYPALDGTQPTQLVLRQTAGPGSLADVSIDYVEGSRAFNVETAELTDGASYTFAYLAKAGSVELLFDTVTFTADNAGPPAPTGLSLTLT